MIKGSVLRDSMISGANSIANQRSQIDELNVFPVPDGDTGTNMSMTIGAAKRDLQGLADGCTVEEASKVAAASMLRGARGNSGVISSLLFRGFSKALVGKKEAGAADIAKDVYKRQALQGRPLFQITSAAKGPAAGLHFLPRFCYDWGENKQRALFCCGCPTLFSARGAAAGGRALSPAPGEPPPFWLRHSGKPPGAAAAGLFRPPRAAGRASR